VKDEVYWNDYSLIRDLEDKESSLYHFDVLIYKMNYIIPLNDNIDNIFNRLKRLVIFS